MPTPAALRLSTAPAAIHAPWKARQLRESIGYPEPIVELKASR